MSLEQPFPPAHSRKNSAPRLNSPLSRTPRRSEIHDESHPSHPLSIAPRCSQRRKIQPTVQTARLEEPFRVDHSYIQTRPQQVFYFQYHAHSFQKSAHLAENNRDYVLNFSCSCALFSWKSFTHNILSKSYPGCTPPASRPETPMTQEWPKPPAINEFPPQHFRAASRAAGKIDRANETHRNLAASTGCIAPAPNATIYCGGKVFRCHDAG
jgi:hypothetical protein